MKPTYSVAEIKANWNNTVLLDNLIPLLESERALYTAEERQAIAAVYRNNPDFKDWLLVPEKVYLPLPRN